MKTSLHRITIAFLLLYILPLGLFAKKADAEKSKKINKTYQVGADHKLNIENKFGEVKITTWDKNQLEVNITIRVEARNDDRAQDRLDEISIDIEEGREETSFETELKDDKFSWGDGQNEIQIDYEVKMPKSNALELKNSFGAFAINDIDGKVEIEVEFGSASIGSINHPESELTFKFCDPVSIGHFEKGELNLKYSKSVELTSATDLKIDSEFSGIEIDGIGNLVMELRFGSIEIDKVIDANIESKMSSVEISELKGKGIFEPSYGKLEIDNVAKDFTSLEVDGEFSPIEIEIEEGAEMKVDLYVSMSNISVPNKQWEKEDKENNSKSYRGTFGNAGDRKVIIHSSFGKIDLNF
jgi:hypothetical protein